MSSNPYNYMDYGVKTIKRQTGCVWLVGHSSACGHRLSLRSIGRTPPLSVTWTAPLQLQYADERYTIVICLCLWHTPKSETPLQILKFLEKWCSAVHWQLCTS